MRTVMVHEIIAIIKFQYVFFLAEVKRDACEIMCTHLVTGEAHRRVIL
jgi:hypothetical protein